MWIGMIHGISSKVKYALASLPRTLLEAPNPGSLSQTTVPLDSFLAPGRGPASGQIRGHQEEAMSLLRDTHGGTTETYEGTQHETVKILSILSSFIILFQSAQDKMTAPQNSTSGAFPVEPSKGPISKQAAPEVNFRRMLSTMGPTQSFFMRESKALGVSWSTCSSMSRRCSGPS